MDELYEFHAAKANQPGYRFDGWFVDPARTRRLNPGADLPGHITIYDKWVPVEYPVTYRVRFGVNNRRNPRSITVESGVRKLYPPLQREAFFEGWYWKGNRIEYLPEGITEAVELTARFSDVPVITFETDGGGQIAPKAVDEQGYLHTFRPPVKMGFLFDGWFEDEQRQIPFQFEKPVLQNLTLYARWKEKAFQIFYDLNGGTFLQEPVCSFEYETPSFLLPVPVRKGYRFQGWQDARQQSIAMIYQHTLGDKKLKAVWTVSQPEVHAMKKPVSRKKSILQKDTVLKKGAVPFSEIESAALPDTETEKDKGVQLGQMDDLSATDMFFDTEKLTIASLDLSDEKTDRSCEEKMGPESEKQRDSTLTAAKSPEQQLSENTVQNTKTDPDQNGQPSAAREDILPITETSASDVCIQKPDGDESAPAVEPSCASPDVSSAPQDEDSVGNAAQSPAASSALAGLFASSGHHIAMDIQAQVRKIRSLLHREESRGEGSTHSMDTEQPEQHAADHQDLISSADEKSVRKAEELKKKESQPRLEAVPVHKQAESISCLPGESKQASTGYVILSEKKNDDEQQKGDGSEPGPDCLLDADHMMEATARQLSGPEVHTDSERKYPRLRRAEKKKDDWW